MIRAIICDCFGVLYYGSLQAFLELAGPDKRSELMNVVTLSDYGYLTRDEFNQSVGELIGKTADEVDAIVTEQRQRNAPMVDYIRSLKQRGLKTALLSNIGSDAVERLFSPQEMTELFDAVVLSYQVQLRKPDSQIYTLTAQRLGIPEEECLMIDDIAENCDGAEMAGMSSLHHVSNEQTRTELETYLA
ncbi:HAD family phosphatase [Candidatus Saccharibacteria bacterium]|nr:HAD family phosphatase [Candidatus Saccharibacteria bacterium]